MRLLATVVLTAVLASSAVGAPSPNEPVLPTPPRARRVIVKVREAVDAGLARTSSPATGRIDLSAASAADPVVAELVARHRVRDAQPLYAARAQARLGGATEAGIAARTTRRFAARSARAPRGERVPDLSRTYVLDLGPLEPIQMAKAMSALRADPQITSVHEETLAQIAYVPNDPSYSTAGSWGQPYDDLYGLKKLGTTQAWDTARGDGVVVAVVDTGIDYTHPDIDANVWINPGEIPANGIDDDANGFVDDVRGWDFVGTQSGAPIADNDPRDGHGHGTHVAGTIAAEGDNNLGVVGVAWQAKVMAVKGIADDGFGPEAGLAAAIVYAVDNGADVINASFGGPGTSPTIRDAVDYAHAQGVVFVAAAGNNNADAAGFYPANLASAVTVAALDAFDGKAYFSNFGNKIDVSAPGVDILSLQRGGGFLRNQGTSMAAPHVSGVAALIIQLHREFTNEQVRQVLRASASDVGAAGKDSIYGYGRPSASGAVAIDQVLEAHITAPADGALIDAPITVHGTARGTGFGQWILEFGSGANPTSWTTLQTSGVPATNAALGTLDPRTLADGPYVVRLRAITSSGTTFSDQVGVVVRYVDLTVPRPPHVPTVLQIYKPGTSIGIVGRATGPSFQSFRLEWAPGFDATTGWSTAGVTLTGGGTSPVTDGIVGAWIPAASLSGTFTIRLTVVNTGFTSSKTTGLYLEPDLVGVGWPRFTDDTGSYGGSAIPVGGRLILCGRGNFGTSSQCESFRTSDGWPLRTQTIKPGDWQVSVGELDPAFGEEILIPDYKSLRIHSRDLIPYRAITSPRQERFGRDQTSLADLDGDGVHEIVALAADTDPSGDFFTGGGSLQVYRADGTFYSSRYPIRFVPPNGGARYNTAHALAVDLDGDGRKEILLGIVNYEQTHYQLQAYNADGTPYAAWTATPVSGVGIQPPLAADLDRDGRMEILVNEWDTAGNPHLRVLDNTGATRPGWPTNGVTIFSPTVADVDGGTQDEIVAITSGGLVIYRADGTLVRSILWAEGGAAGVTNLVVADIDGDAQPELLASWYVNYFPAIGERYRESRLRAMRPDGAVVREWNLPGTFGAQTAGRSVAAVGDFTGDGLTDIAVHVSLIDGGGIDGSLVNGYLTLLTTGTAFDPARVDWPMNYRDPQNSRHRSAASTPPATRVEPLADAYVRDGTHANTNFGTATSLDVKNTSATGNNRVSYLRFSVRAFPSSIASAKLRLYGRRGTATTATVSAYAVADNTWVENQLNWTFRPALGAKQGASVRITPTAQYYEWDVTSFVRGAKQGGVDEASFALRMDPMVNEAPDTFNSREAADHRPELVIVPGAVDAPPTVAVPAAASPSPVTGRTTQLSVLGADDHGESALTYTWSVVGTPPATVAFSTNGSNAARNTIVTFTAYGTYDFQVSIRDAQGQAATSSVTVDVLQTLTRIELAPPSVVVPPGGSTGFRAGGFDQFGALLDNEHDGALFPHWAVTGGGTIDQFGAFTAGLTPGGPFIVTATTGGLTGVATITVANTTTLAVLPSADAYVRDGGSANANFGTATSLIVKSSSATGNNRIAYLRFPLTGVNGEIVSAILRLYGSRPTEHLAKDRVYGVASTSWSETGLTWNNRPALGEAQGKGLVIGSTGDGYWTFDVASWVRARKAAGATSVTLAFKMDDLTDLSPDTFHSREAAANRPELVVRSIP
jgi:subtilisin family serine protease